MQDLFLTEPPSFPGTGFLGFPLTTKLKNLDANIVILGIPYGKPYYSSEIGNDQSTAPDLLRKNAQDAAWDEPRTVSHFDWDLGGPLLDGKRIKIVDCGNVRNNLKDPNQHYLYAEAVARQIFSKGATLITIGGDHGVPIPVIRALPPEKDTVLIQIDAHMDWRNSVNGEKEGYSSTMRRASEMAHIGNIFQIGLRGVGSARQSEIDSAKDYGANLISAYELHSVGVASILARIPNGQNYYITLDADGLDPSIMPSVNAPTPGGLSWVQIRELLHGIVKKGKVLGMDLVEISPSLGDSRTTFVHAERLICNFIGACVRAGYYD